MISRTRQGRNSPIVAMRSFGLLEGRHTNKCDACNVEHPTSKDGTSFVLHAIPGVEETSSMLAVRIPYT